MKSKKLKITITIFVLVIFVFAIALIFKNTLWESSASKNEFYTVKTEVYENIIEISGTVEAAQTQSLQALGTGTVTAVYVEAGDVVKKGDVIIQLDDSDQVYNLEKHDYDMTTKQISGSAREIELMETERLALLQKISDRKVIATFDGIIADLSVSVGDSLEAKDSVGTLVNVDYLTAEVEVAETDVSKLEIGQKVKFTFSAYDGEVEGYVTSWPAIGEVTSRGATVVMAKIRIDDYPEEILPNYSFTGKIEISPSETFVLVEKEAVGHENRESFVELVNGEKIKVKAVPYTDEYMKILSGLSGGEILKPQSSKPVSGKNPDRIQNQNNSNSSRNNNQNQNRGGFGGPPPGGF